MQERCCQLSPPKELVITFIDLFVLFHSSLSGWARTGELQADCLDLVVSIYSSVQGAMKSIAAEGGGRGRGE